MGEQKFRIFNVGAPQLDEFRVMKTPPPEEIRKKFGLDKKKPAILLVQHSVTEEFRETQSQMEASLKAVASFDCPTVIILNNSDAGSRMIRNAITAYRAPQMKIFEHVPRPEYAGLLKTCDALVGNSSAGIIESPFFHIPVVNIGNRQKGRMQSTNVINVGYQADGIRKAIVKALTPAFRAVAKRAPSIYGDGRSAKRIVDILETTPLDDKLVVKELSY